LAPSTRQDICGPRPTKFLTADTNSNSSIVHAEAPMMCVGCQTRELRTTQVKQRLVIAGFDVNLRLRLDAVIDNDIMA
jgi:hypothetical protein